MKDIKKRAEEYAELKARPEIYQTRKLEKAKVYKAVLYGAKLATEWNDPEEKPERHKHYNDNSVNVLISVNGVIYMAYYDFVDKAWFEIDSENYSSKSSKTFYEIDGWQYLPEIK